MKKQFSVLIVIACLFGLCVPGIAQSCTTATCNAASPNEADVLAALPSSDNTNPTVVVNIPSGSATWTTTFNYTVPSAVTSLTIQGATVVTCSGTPGTSGYFCSSVDKTIINDDVTNPSTPLWVIDTSSATALFRITGLTLQPLNSAVTAKSQGIVNFVGNTKNFRWDHSDIIVSQNDNSGPELDGQIEGVFDHNLMQLGNASNFTNGVRIYNDLFDNAGFGDGGWAAPTQWGSQHAIFIESNYVVGGYTTDCGIAGREVLRYNTFFNSQDTSGAIHSTKDPAGAERGCRSEEFYHNYASTSVPGNTMTGGEGSTLIEWGNTLGTVANTFYTGGIWRSQPGQVSNEPAGMLPPSGWAMCGSSTGYLAASAWDGNSSTATGYPCLDDIGRGQQTQAMNGANFPNRINVVTGTQSWPHQYLEPAYFWMNTLPSGMGAAVNIGGTAVNNRDYFYDCNSYNSSCSGGFTGAAGTGSGLLSARPSSCSAGPGGTYGTSPTGSYGVAYWATDANSGNGELYVCTSTNTWTPIYQPYTYPHPLVSGTSTTSSAPAAPTNLVSTAY